MKYLNALLFIVLLISGCATETEELTTFILIRHAEKGNDGTDDPDLTDEGRARVEKLSFMFKNTPLAAIYSTNFKRTVNTVKPIAETQDLVVRPYEAFKPDVIENMVEEHRGGTVLISGHSDTAPWTTNLLLGKEVYKDYAETEYGIILIVSVKEAGEFTSVTRINY